MLGHFPAGGGERQVVPAPNQSTVDAAGVGAAQQFTRVLETEVPVPLQRRQIFGVVAVEVEVPEKEDRPPRRPLGHRGQHLVHLALSDGVVLVAPARFVVGVVHVHAACPDAQAHHLEALAGQAIPRVVHGAVALAVVLLVVGLLAKYRQKGQARAVEVVVQRLAEPALARVWAGRSKDLVVGLDEVFLQRQEIVGPQERGDELLARGGVVAGELGRQSVDVVGQRQEAPLRGQIHARVGGRIGLGRATSEAEQHAQASKRRGQALLHQQHRRGEG